MSNLHSSTWTTTTTTTIRCHPWVRGRRLDGCSSSMFLCLFACLQAHWCLFSFSQSSMSRIHHLFGRPLSLVPCTASAIISLPKVLSSLRIVCPQYFNFLVLMLGMSCSISLRILMFVLFCVQNRTQAFEMAEYQKS